MYDSILCLILLGLVSEFILPMGIPAQVVWFRTAVWVVVMEPAQRRLAVRLSVRVPTPAAATDKRVTECEVSQTHQSTGCWKIMEVKK